MKIENVYESNETMRFLGYQCPLLIINEEVKKQMNDVMFVRKDTENFMENVDMFMLGYIYGKRAERKRRKVKL